MEQSSIATGYSYITIRAEEIEKQYEALVGPWEKGRLLNRDAKLVHMAAHSALAMSHLDLKRTDKSRIALVLATTLGTFESYETFFESMSNHEPKPTAFSNALPNIAAGALSVFYGLTGPSLTLSSGPDGGVDALMASLDMIEMGAVDAVLVGAWYMPSRTTALFDLPVECEVALVLLESSEKASETRRALARICRSYQKNAAPVAETILAEPTNGERKDDTEKCRIYDSNGFRCNSMPDGRSLGVSVLRLLKIGRAHV